MILAFATVLPLVCMVCFMIPFSYEVNDDSAMEQILNGSYTGVPDSHAVFMRYPLSLVIKLLYEWKPAVNLFGNRFENINWYIITIIFIETVALIAVLYRLLNFFGRNRILICTIYGLGFLKIWSSCFTRLTFSTASAFMGCMALAFFVLESEKEAVKPWNIVFLIFMMVCAYCLRKQGLYMVVPFMLLEFVRKYHFNLLKTIRPWVILFAGLIVIVCCNYMHKGMYSTKEWKDFMAYNHARAYMQDYNGFPDYEDEKEFYTSHNISFAEKQCLQNYRYLLLDDMNPELIIELSAHMEKKQQEIPLKEKLITGKDRFIQFMFKKDMAPLSLKYASFFAWFLVFPVMLITMIWLRKKDFSLHVRNFLYAFFSGCVLFLEWFYLAMNGRFPQRVEETIRLVMLTSALLIICIYMQMWKDEEGTNMHPVFQCVLIISIVLVISPVHTLKAQGTSQRQYMNLQSDKAEIINYCADYPENIYIFDTKSMVSPFRPQDNYSNHNWYASGSWLAFSPLYYEKLKAANIDNLNSGLYLNDNVYIIAKEKVPINEIIGVDDPGQVGSILADQICTQSMNYFNVYKVNSINNNDITEKKEK